MPRRDQSMRSRQTARHQAWTSLSPWDTLYITSDCRVAAGPCGKPPSCFLDQGVRLRGSNVTGP
jgi:hypothetical protein